MRKHSFINYKKLMIVGILIVVACGLYFVYQQVTASNITFTIRSPEVEVHEEFDARSIIESVVDGNIEEVEIDDSKLNKDIIGEYPVLYKYRDEEIKIIVSVVDTQPPIFDVKNIEIDLGMEVDISQIVENIQDVSDTEIYFKDNYDFSNMGDINVVVVVEDVYGNKAEKKVLVHILEKDEEAPKIDGVKDLTIRKGNTNIDYLKEIQVYDNQDPLPSIIVNSKAVDINTVGTYEITYIARDRSGNQDTSSCIVQVVENKTIGTSEQSKEKIVYLTFDDGPSKYTKDVMDILEQYDIKATFFVTGMNPDYFYLIKELENKGHTIGLHTYSHNYADIYASADAYYADLQKIANLCEQQIGYVPKYIRFPGGSSNTVSRKYCAGIMQYLVEDVVLQGYQFYDWNVSSGDAGGTLPAMDIVAYSTMSSANNINLLFHDANGKQTTVEALPAIIEHYQGLGYRFLSIDDDSYAPHHAVNN